MSVSNAGDSPVTAVALKPVIYEVVVRYFGNLNTTNQPAGTLAENGCGRFEDLNTAALTSLRSLGATHIWLSGCLRQATLTDYSELGLPPDDPDVVKGIAGSIYAIRDCFDVCPDYAANPAQRMAEFESLVRRIHDAGMKVLIDFVPNHVARSYHSVVKPELDFGQQDDQTKFFSPTNHYFYLVGAQLKLTRPHWWNPPWLVFDGRFPPEDGSPGHTPKVTGDNGMSPDPTEHSWYETVKLNYGYNFLDGSKHFDPRPQVWDIMDRVLEYWQSKGVDGFRCDMAHLIPHEAWEYLIGNARSPTRDPDCYFLAEAYPASAPGAPITDLGDLLRCGFDAVYRSGAYNALKYVYQGSGTLDDYDREVASLGPTRRGWLTYLENDGERRIDSCVILQIQDHNGLRQAGPHETGFGSLGASYQLAPLHLLLGNGPVLVFNGQEIGEPEPLVRAGFSPTDGRTTTFDYWCMTEFVKWVNGHAYDCGELERYQRALRHFYTGLLRLCQDPSVRGDGYWGLRYYNRSSRFPDCPDDIYTFARFQAASGRLLLVAANFRPGRMVAAQVRIPEDLANLVGLRTQVTVRLVLDREGARDCILAQLTREALIHVGIAITLPDQTTHVLVIE